jgi:phosphate uptake regulator
MRRKLVKQGPSTMTLSIPKNWIDRFNLKNGDEVDLDEVETKLIISSINKAESSKSIEYDFEHISENQVHLFLVGMYKSGLKDIYIKNINPKQITKILEIVSNSPGFEIIDRTKNSLRIIDIGLASEETIIKSENQIYWKLINLIETIIENKSSKEEIYHLDTEINRLSFFIQRNLASKFSINSKTFLEYEKVAILEGLGDALRSYNKYSKKGEEELKILEKISKILEEIRIFENKNDNVLLQRIYGDIELLRNKTRINEKKPEISLVLIRPIIRLIVELYESLVASKIKEFAIDIN